MKTGQWREKTIDALSISEVVQRAMFINDTNSGFLGADTDALDVIRGFTYVFQLFMDDMGSLNSSLGMELGRKRDLKKNVFHDIRSVGPLEFKWFSLRMG